MPQLDFYFAPGACSLVSHIALEEAGLEFTAHPISVLTGEHRTADYLAISPSGKVPSLVVDGVPLGETLAILFWIARTQPSAGILPNLGTLQEEADAVSLLSWFAATVHPVFTRFRVPPAIIDDPACFEKVARHAAPVLAGYFGIAAARLGERDWLLGTWSIADAYLFWLWTEAVSAGFDPVPFPSLAAHAARSRARPATRRALAREAEGAPAPASPAEAPQRNPNL